MHSRKSAGEWMNEWNCAIGKKASGEKSSKTAFCYVYRWQYSAYSTLTRCTSLICEPSGLGCVCCWSSVPSTSSPSSSVSSCSTTWRTSAGLCSATRRASSACDCWAVYMSRVLTPLSRRSRTTSTRQGQLQIIRKSLKPEITWQKDELTWLINGVCLVCEQNVCNVPNVGTCPLSFSLLQWWLLTAF